jgi:hypothetical protein
MADQRMQLSMWQPAVQLQEQEQSVTGIGEDVTGDLLTRLDLLFLALLVAS